MDHEDLLYVITDGLGEGDKAIVDMVNGRDVSITIDEIHEKLINHENTLKVAGTTDISVTVTANVTQSRQQQQTHPYSSSRGGFSASLGGFRQPRPYLGQC